MKHAHFDALIVGSGFGGSVMAYRLAEAGLRVCLLERGKAYPPGSFPKNPREMENNFWNPSEGLHGLFNIWSFDKFQAVVSSGLGGGSLISANVMNRKDERWFVKEDLKGGGFEFWPVTRADLEPHYDQVEKMLRAQPYPFDTKPYDEVPKTKELKEAAERLGLDWRWPRLAITFGNEGEKPVPEKPIKEAYPNLHGRTRYTCRLVSECVIGCNYGSKNTLDYNYLSEARRYGAEIRTRCEVKAFEPRNGGGYAVNYVEHDPEREGQKTDTSRLREHKITTDRLVLAAGTLGTTFLMLKNRRAFPKISKQLGTRFNANGELLAFVVRLSDSKGDESKLRTIDASYGPVITSAIRVADREDGGDRRGFYVEDAGYPEFVDYMVRVFLATNATRSNWRDVFTRRRKKWANKDSKGDMVSEIPEWFDSTKGSVDFLPLLSMGRDIPDGLMKLRGNELIFDWQTKRSELYFEGVRETMRDIARELGGHFWDPLRQLDRSMVLHPLGGCPMGRSVKEGVVDPYGQVFNYPGFYVVDGSVMPGAVGTNPSLTIAALADRLADRVVDNRSL